MTLTESKKRGFRDMQEHPGKYTDQELEALMTDLDRVPDTDEAWRRFEHRLHRATPLRRWFPRVAAGFVGALLLAGILFAAITSSHRLSSSAGEQSQSSSAAEMRDTVRFDNVRLDSLLHVVASHYGKAVQFRNDKVREMRFIMTWSPQDSLTDLIARLQHFDGLSISLVRDTIVVSSNDGEGK